MTASFADLESHLVEIAVESHRFPDILDFFNDVIGAALKRWDELPE
jgi:hypothetical protein